jgi:penicillin-binding protein 1A
VQSNNLSPEDIKRYNSYIWKFLFGCIGLFFLMILLTAFGAFGDLPSFRDLENPKSNLASEVISEDKAILGKYFVQNRSRVNYNQISPNVIRALIATEDNHFYGHSGIDFARSFTILIYNIVGHKQGGSTITQQLAKNLYSDPANNIFARIMQKMKEWVIAVKLERHYSKEEIITMYLNTVDFGAYRTFGISSAAHTYFNTTADKLTPDQAALLIQMVKGTTMYSPIRNPERALGRRNFVLSRMAAAGFLSNAQAEEFKKKPIGLDLNPSDHNEGLATYFRAVLKRDIQKIFAERSIAKADGTPYDLDRDGLKIYTTINSVMQGYAEDAQAEYMRNLQVQFNAHWKGVSRWNTIANFKLLLDQGIRRSDRYRALKQQGKSDEDITKDFNTPTRVELFTWKGNIDTVMKPIDSIVFCKMTLRNSMMSMDPTTGYIKAWVGGTSFEHFKYDQVKMGTRQVGSTAKPFTYAVAIQNGYSPCFEVNNVPDTIRGYGPPWCPASPGTKPGRLTLLKALANSQNWITAHMMKLVTPAPVAELIKKMGITSAVPAYPSICLGVFDASVYDMTGAYSVFANHGVWTEPTYLLRIEDKNGALIYDNKPKKVQAMDEQTAYVMTYMLKDVVAEGSGYRLRGKYGLTNPIGGKTGTTQKNSDGWFIGITPQLVTGVWTGCEDRDIHFRTLALGEGANTALPIFALYMQKVYEDQSLGINKNVDFAPPKGPLTITLDCSAYSQQQNPTPAPPANK